MLMLTSVTMPRGIPKTKEAAPPPSHQPYEELFLQSLRECLPGLHLYSDERLRQKIGVTKVQDLSLEFFSFIEVGAGSGLKRNELLALANQSFKCLKSYIKTMGLPLTLKTLLDSLSLLPQAVDEAFPGYFESRLLQYT